MSTHACAIRRLPVLDLIGTSRVKEGSLPAASGFAVRRTIIAFESGRPVCGIGRTGSSAFGVPRDESASLDVRSGKSGKTALRTRRGVL
jgi:hypothetical protein